MLGHLDMFKEIETKVREKYGLQTEGSTAKEVTVIEEDYENLSEEIQDDGSVIMEIVKEYGNRTPVGSYLD